MLSFVTFGDVNGSKGAKETAWKFVNCSFLLGLIEIHTYKIA